MTGIEDGAFANIPEIKKVTMYSADAPKKYQKIKVLSSLGNNVFAGCTNLESVELASTITSIGTGCFKGCTNLKTITVGLNGTQLREQQLPEAIVNIPAETFAGCTLLKHCDISQAKTIGAGAFKACEALDQVVFPSSLTAVEANAFAGCTGLKLIDARAVANASVYHTDAFNDATLQADARLLVSFGTETAYGENAATAAIDHLVVDCPTQSLATILNDGNTGYHYRIGSSDIEGLVAQQNAGNKTYAFNYYTLRLAERPEGLQDYDGINDLSEKGYTYDRSTWVQLDNVTLMPGKKLGTGNTFKIIDKVNPTLSFEAGYDIDAAYNEVSTVVTGNILEYTYAMNEYCPANFVPQSEYYFVEPQPCEVAVVKWAIYAGNDEFYVPAKQTTVNGVMNEGELNGGFKIDRSLYSGDDFKEGYAYTFTGVIKRATTDASDAPRRADTFVARTTGGTSSDWVFAPIVVTAEDNVVTGIESVTRDEADVPARYINLAGQVSDTPHAGVNIVVRGNKATKVVF